MPGKTVLYCPGLLCQLTWFLDMAKLSFELFTRYRTLINQIVNKELVIYTQEEHLIMQFVQRNIGVIFNDLIFVHECSRNICIFADNIA